MNASWAARLLESIVDRKDGELHSGENSNQVNELEEHLVKMSEADEWALPSPSKKKLVIHLLIGLG